MIFFLFQHWLVTTCRVVRMVIIVYVNHAIHEQLVCPMILRSAACVCANVQLRSPQEIY